MNGKCSQIVRSPTRIRPCIGITDHSRTGIPRAHGLCDRSDIKIEQEPPHRNCRHLADRIRREDTDKKETTPGQPTGEQKRDPKPNSELQVDGKHDDAESIDQWIEEVGVAQDFYVVGEPNVVGACP